MPLYLNAPNLVAISNGIVALLQQYNRSAPVLVGMPQWFYYCQTYIKLFKNVCDVIHRRNVVQIVDNINVAES